MVARITTATCASRTLTTKVACDVESHILNRLLFMAAALFLLRVFPDFTVAGGVL